VSNKTSAGPASKPIGVFVLEDQEIVRRGIRVLLEAEPDIEVTGEASTAASALARIPALRPGVAVLDVQLPDGDRVSVCREVRSRAPEVACLMLTAFSDDEALLGSIMAERPATCSSRSAARIWSARSAWSPPVSRCWPLAGLTVRERKVLELIGEGLTNRQIGERLFVSVKTVKHYVTALFVKLGMEQRTQAAAYAARVFDGRRFELSQDMEIINRKP